LEKAKTSVSTANNEMVVKRIGPIGLIFDFNDFMLFELLKEVHVKPSNQNKDDDFSVLGLDFLRRYSIRFDEYVVYLKK
jgi:hypothetical protein